MVKEALQYIIEQVQAAKPFRENINGIEYCDKDLKALRPPKAEPLKFQRLQALADLVLHEWADWGSFVHIVSPTRVDYLGVLDQEFRDREYFATATFESVFTLGVRGAFHPPENLVIALQAEFNETEDLARLREIVGNVAAEMVQSASDDGISQVVAVKQGITLVGKKPIENPFKLAPHRTFSEVEQPASIFILRARSQDKGLPCFALFEADNQRWKLDAIGAIKAWLTERLPGVDILG